MPPTIAPTLTPEDGAGVELAEGVAVLAVMEVRGRVENELVGRRLGAVGVTGLVS